MIGYFRKEEPIVIDEQIEKLRTELNTYDVDSEEYRVALGYLERVMELKTQPRHGRVTPDTMAHVIGTLLGIVIIVAYEQKHVMTSKAFGFGIKKNP